MFKRGWDIVIAGIFLVAFIIPMLIIALAVKLTSRGPAIHWSRRIGRDNIVFLMPKFRTMYVTTPQVATHLLNHSETFITPVGRFLRKTSLDELPQLWSVLTGDMSLVGPRPALFNQDDLKALRTQCGVHQLRPGITGWAQVNGRDELPLSQKVSFDEEYLKRKGWLFDMQILWLTVWKVLKSDGVKH